MTILAAFKAYVVRVRIPDELNLALVCRIGEACAVPGSISPPLPKGKWRIRHI